MKPITVVLLLLFLGVAQPSSAQDGTLTILCEECRDIVNYPQDVRNFAVNQLFGSSSWLTFDQADRFNVADMHGNIVHVDLNLEYVYVEINLPLTPHFIDDLLEIVPSDTIIQVRLIYEDGTIKTFSFSLGDLDPNGTLPVGSSGSGGGGGTGGGGSGGGGTYVYGISTDGDNGNYCGPGTPYDCIYY